MAGRKVFLGKVPTHPELDKQLEVARSTTLTDEQLQQQRVSFAYGNAPVSSGITKASVQRATKTIRVTP
jgi:hypothetical protein